MVLINHPLYGGLAATPPYLKFIAECHPKFVLLKLDYFLQRGPNSRYLENPSYSSVKLNTQKTINYPSEALRREIIQQYGFFRAMIARVVQDFVLNGTVQRFGDYINVKSLEKVVGLEKAEVYEIYQLYQRCNDLVEAHDPSSPKNEPPPNPDELNQNIVDLKKLFK